MKSVTGGDGRFEEVRGGRNPSDSTTHHETCACADEPVGPRGSRGLCGACVRRATAAYGSDAAAAAVNGKSAGWFRNQRLRHGIAPANPKLRADHFTEAIARAQEEHGEGYTNDQLGMILQRVEGTAKPRLNTSLSRALKRTGRKRVRPELDAELVIATIERIGSVAGAARELGVSSHRLYRMPEVERCLAGRRNERDSLRAALKELLLLGYSHPEAARTMGVDVAHAYGLSSKLKGEGWVEGSIAAVLHRYDIDRAEGCVRAFRVKEKHGHTIVKGEELELWQVPANAPLKAVVLEVRCRWYSEHTWPVGVPRFVQRLRERDGDIALATRCRACRRTPSETEITTAGALIIALGLPPTNVRVNAIGPTAGTVYPHVDLEIVLPLAEGSHTLWVDLDTPGVHQGMRDIDQAKLEEIAKALRPGQTYLRARTDNLPELDEVNAEQGHVACISVSMPEGRPTSVSIGRQMAQEIERYVRGLPDLRLDRCMPTAKEVAAYLASSASGDRLSVLDIAEFDPLAPEPLRVENDESYPLSSVTWGSDMRIVWRCRRPGCGHEFPAPACSITRVLRAEIQRAGLGTATPARPVPGRPQSRGCSDCARNRRCRPLRETAPTEHVDAVAGRLRHSRRIRSALIRLYEENFEVTPDLKARRRRGEDACAKLFGFLQFDGPHARWTGPRTKAKTAYYRIDEKWQVLPRTPTAARRPTAPRKVLALLADVVDAPCDYPGCVLPLALHDSGRQATSA